MAPRMGLDRAQSIGQIVPVLVLVNTVDSFIFVVVTQFFVC